jgi:hypothetical protein
MFPFHLLRSFYPFENPIGFGAVDFVELALAALLVLLVIARPVLEPVASKLALRTGWCMLLLGLLPIALRLVLLVHYPVPTPYVADEFSYILLADTLRHFRLTNPPHALPQFFETYFVLQQPTYSSIYALGQGLVLALGWLVFGHPWAGVALSVAALCALCYWMLRAWTTPAWALLGGLLAVIQFGPLNQWMNSYWGGAVCAAAGCLVFGWWPRLWERWRRRDAALLGAGIAIHLLTRPYECIFLCLAVILFFLPVLRDRYAIRNLIRTAAIVVLVVLPAIGLTLFHNQQVTGNWTTHPYALSRYEYGIPTSFTFQPKAVPHRDLTPQQQLDYLAQADLHGDRTDTVGTYLERLGRNVRFYRFFFLIPLYLALPFYFFRTRDARYAWVLLVLLVFALGTNFYPYFFTHYIAAETCLFVLIGVTALERLSRFSVRGSPAGLHAARLLIFLCLAHFFFWYGLHLVRTQDFAAAAIRFETWDAINYGDPDGRIAIANELAQAPGTHLVFVRYGSQHRFKEWVFNAADIDSARVVWARDLGSDEDEELRQYYPGRTVWLLEPDARPPRLSRYLIGSSSGIQELRW